MTIKEQIEIARLIASGTPREVAIKEDKFRGVMPASADRSGAMEAEVVKKKIKPEKQKNKQQNLPKGKKGGEIDKKSPSDLAKEKLDVIKQKQQDLKKRRKESNSERRLEMLRRKKNVVRNSLADRVKNSDFSGANIETVSKDEGGASATQKAVGNVAKTGVSATSNVAKGLAKAVVGVRDLKRGYSDRAVAKQRYKDEKEKQDLKKAKKALKNEEFIQEVEKKEKSGTKKVIDIMRGKNSIKVNPDMKEDTVVVQDASGKDFVEVVDIVSPSKVRSDWRKEINVTEASAAWTRKAGKNKSGGLNEKGRKSYERENPGSDLKAPSKKVGNPRRKSFCARMKGMKKKLTSKKTARDPNSRINKSLRAWNC